MMRIGEAAHAAGVTPRALRYYEQRGLISAERDHNGHRVYADATVPVARTVARLLAAGLSSDDVLRFRDCLHRERPGAGADCTATFEVYVDRLSVLDQRIAALTELRERLAQEIEELRGHRAA